jgi:hypothetical protein
MSAIEKVPFVPRSEGFKTGAPGPQYNVSIGYLRAFITVLVVAHHAALVRSAIAGESRYAATLVDGPWGGSSKLGHDRCYPADSRGWTRDLEKLIVTSHTRSSPPRRLS